MDDPFARLWWMLALRGLAGIGFGALVAAWPLFTLELLLAVFGVYAAVDGAFALHAGVQQWRCGNSWWPLAAEGVIGIGLGAAILAFPGPSAFVLWYLVAGWALATGACEIVAALRWRRYTQGETLLAGAGLAGVALGLAMLGWPRVALYTLAWLVGLYAALFGLLLVAMALRLRRAAHAGGGRAEWAA